MTKQDRINEVTTLVRDIDATKAKLAELEQRLEQLVNPTAKAAPVKRVTTGTVKAEKTTPIRTALPDEDGLKVSLLLHLRNHPGVRYNATALANAINVEPKQVSAVISKLSGIQSEGNRRAKVYWLEPENTDEKQEAAE